MSDDTSSSRVRAGRWIPVAASVFVGAGVVVSVVAAAALMTGNDDGTADDGGTAAGEEVLQTELDAMLEAGVHPDDPKVGLLEDELEDLEALADAEGVPAPPPEPPPDADDGPDVGERREVDCEPVPPDLLTMDDIADATCYVEPQSDGGTRYIAVGPDGTERTVRFSVGGGATREPDVPNGG